ncbi:MAG: TonB-dependent receptor [Campylobacteraceae bacterium]|nr:TonB-dependent receptor [Campylobacteraceae bacterium]
MRFKALCLSVILSSHLVATDSVKLDSVVVTAGLGQEQSIDDVQASVEVIGEKEIKTVGFKTVPQMLKNAQSIDVKDSGSYADVRIRGFDSDYTLILVDGVRRTGKYGKSSLVSIAAEDVERIEIIRGPMSVLYGADALAGVVNIITKKGIQEDSFGLSVVAGMYGGEERKSLNTRVYGTIKQSENVSHAFTLESRNQEKYWEDRSSVGTTLNETDQIFLAYSNTILLSGSDTLTNRLEFTNQDDDGISSRGIDTYEKEKRYQASSAYNRVGNNYIFDANIAYGYSDAEVHRGSGVETTKYSQLELNTYFRHFTTDYMTNILGAGYRYETIDVSMYTKKAHRYNANTFFQNELDITENLTSNIGVRYDYFSDFGSEVTPKVSLAYKLDDFVFRAGYAAGYKAPGFSQMYGYFTRGPYIISGSPDLKAEESDTYELSVNYRGESLSAFATYHYSSIDNLINSHTVRRVGRTSYVSYRNIDKATISGVELGLDYDFTKELSAGVSWSYLDTEDKQDGGRLTGSARNTFKVSLAYEPGDFGFYFNLRRYMDYYGPDEVSGNSNINYTIADVKASYQVNKNLNLFLGVNNLFDKEMPYSMQSRNGMGGDYERYYYIGFDLKL